MIYFISGHRDISKEEFNQLYVPAINEALRDQDVKFVVGDYEGVDIMAQEYLSKVADLKHSQVTVYHMFSLPRNFYSPKFNTKGGYKTDEERDAAMTRESDRDIAFVRRGKRNSGTAQNIVRRYEFG